MKIEHDKFGPEKIITVHDSSTEMRGFLVIDNTKLGLGKGGIRMTPTVSVEEVCRLARTMTWKNALAGIPFGGAKAGIVWLGGSDTLKKRQVQSFARAISEYIPKKYIAGPDVNSGEKEMLWIAEALNNKKASTGKPKSLGGLPHELGSTGFGVAHSTKIAADLLGMNIKNTRVAIEGFGNVGSFAFKFLKQMGFNVVAVSDSKATAYLEKSEKGFDGKLLLSTKKKTGTVGDYPNAKKLPKEAIFGLPVDILVLATITDVINEKNKKEVKAKLIVEGSNIPMSEKIEKEFNKKGIFVIPDFVANAGGVISSYAEYKGYTPEKMFKLVEEKIKESSNIVISESLKNKLSPRETAMLIAQKKIE
ncbi:MAG: Glu/Leu/Phe/Val dehydrogenase [Patescibacteria group bacterium]